MIFSATYHKYKIILVLYIVNNKQCNALAIIHRIHFNMDSWYYITNIFTYLKLQLLSIVKAIRKF